METRMSMSLSAILMGIRPSWGRRFSAMSSLGHDLQAGDHGRLVSLGRGQPLVEDAVDPVPDLQLLLERFDMDVAGPLLHRLEEDEVDQADHRGFIAHVEQVLGLFQFLEEAVAGSPRPWTGSSLPGVSDPLFVETVDRPEDLALAAEDRSGSPGTPRMSRRSSRGS